MFFIFLSPLFYICGLKDFYFTNFSKITESKNLTANKKILFLNLKKINLKKFLLENKKSLMFINYVESF